MRLLTGLGLPLIYAVAVYLSTRPPKPVYVLANKTVMTVSAEPGPAILHAPEPEYPAQALHDGIEGSVKLKVTIAPDGTVANAIALSGPLPLRQAAIDTVRRWQFEAGADQTEVEIPFALRGANREPLPAFRP